MLAINGTYTVREVPSGFKSVFYLLPVLFCGGFHVNWMHDIPYGITDIIYNLGYHGCISSEANV